jgi:hypothetical protein
MSVKPVEGEYTDVVVQADWVCVASEGGFSPYVYGVATFTTPGDPFTPYQDLTQDQVLEWCWENGVDKTAIEAQLAAQLENLLKPPVITPPLPWVPPPN